MTFPQPLGNDQVERLADGLTRRKAEQPLGTRIPEADDTVSIGRDDRIGPRGEKSLRLVSR
jgi:hypothetical protein